MSKFRKKSLDIDEKIMFDFQNKFLALKNNLIKEAGRSGKNNYNKIWLAKIFSICLATLIIISGLALIKPQAIIVLSEKIVNPNYFFNKSNKEGICLRTERKNKEDKVVVAGITMDDFKENSRHISPVYDFFKNNLNLLNKNFFVFMKRAEEKQIDISIKLDQKLNNYLNK